MGGKQNTKPNPLPNLKPNPKTVGEKSFPNPNPQDPKPADIHPEPDPLSSLVFIEVPLSLDQTRYYISSIYLYIF
jgi:hypothetical protein